MHAQYDLAVHYATGDQVSEMQRKQLSGFYKRLSKVMLMRKLI